MTDDTSLHEFKKCPFEQSFTLIPNLYCMNLPHKRTETNKKKKEKDWREMTERTGVPDEF